MVKGDTHPSTLDTDYKEKPGGLRVPIGVICSSKKHSISEGHRHQGQVVKVILQSLWSLPLRNIIL